MSSRDQILRRIRAATTDITSPPNIPRRYRPASAAISAGRGSAEADDALTSLFEERAADYRVTVRRCPGTDAARVIAAAVAARGARRIGVPCGFPAEWSAELPEAVPDEPPLEVAALDALDGVVTTCAVAIAETGTIVLDAGPGQGSRAFTVLTITWPQCAPGRSSPPSLTRSPRSTRCGRSPGSAGPAPRATSNSSGSRAFMGPGRWILSSSPAVSAGVNDQCAWCAERVVPALALAGIRCEHQRDRRMARPIRGQAVSARRGQPSRRWPWAAGIPATVESSGVRRELGPVCGGAEAVVRQEAAGKVVLIWPPDRTADAGD